MDEFGPLTSQCQVDEDKCIGCKACVKTGCPAIWFDTETRKVSIDKSQCVGCGVCEQVCKFDAIEKVGV